jgi:outer membrane protein assembly factor BamD
MKNILRLITTSLVIVLITSGCSSNKDEKSKVETKPPVELYEDAKSALKSANFEKAQEILEALDSRYPFGAHSDQVQLDLIYTYYKLNETALALANIDRFIRLNPTHSDLDYLYYMRGLTNMATDQHFFQNLFGVDRFNRDPGYSQQAFADFSRVIEYYPNSQYAADAWQRMVYIKNRLALYELDVAKWYVKRKAYIAAINRAKIILNNYPDTRITETALGIMIECYEALGLTQPKENALAVLKLNNPENHIVRRYEHDKKESR